MKSRKEIRTELLKTEALREWTPPNADDAPTRRFHWAEFRSPVPPLAGESPSEVLVVLADGTSGVVLAEEAVLGNVVDLPDGRRCRIESIL